MKLILSQTNAKLLFATTALVLCPPSLAGTSDPGVAELIFIVVKGGIFLVVALSILFAALVFKGYFRFLAVLVVMFFWGWLYNTKLAIPANVSRAKDSQRSAAVSQCKNEISGLETPIHVDGILDETASIGLSQVVQLLDQRKLTFVEFKVQPIENQGKGSAFSTVGGITDLVIDRPEGTVVRIALGKVGDPLCTSLLNVSEEKRRFANDTLSAGNCLKVNFTVEPDARYAITYSADHPQNTNFRYWKIVDRQKSAVLAQLTTSEAGQSSMADKPLSKGPELNIPSWDCSYPHTILVDRLFGTDQSSIAKP